MKRFFSVILGVVTLLMSILGALPVSAQNNLTCTAYALNNNTVAVDGEIDPVWQNAYSYDLGYLKKNYTYKNIANLADVGVKLLWDNNKTLYILVEIADSTRYTEQSGTAWWENDSFELWLYINGVAKALRVGRDGYISGWTSSDNPRWPWSDIAISDTADSWIVEYKISLDYWQDTSKNEIPYSTKSMLVDFIYNDATAENNGRQALIGWCENTITGASMVEKTSLGNCYLSEAGVGTATTQITGTSLSIKDDFTLFYYVKVLDNVSSSLSMRFTMNNETVVVSNYHIVDGELVFPLVGIAPHQMCDIIKAELLADGVVIAVKEAYSIKENAQALLDEYYFDAELVRLVSNILYYGEAAQNYKDYNLSNLPTSGINGIADVETIVPSDEDRFSISGNDNPNLCINSANVLYNTTSKLYFNIYKSPTITEPVKIVLNESEYYFSDLEALGDGNYMLSTEGISATDHDKIYTLELIHNDQCIASLDYSINAYAYSMSNNADVNEKAKALALALYRYGVAAENYEVDPDKIVFYTDFGAIGDGTTDDLAAIIAAHKYANLHGLSVKADSGKTFYIGVASEGAVIKTDTDFTGASFIIDDRDVPLSERKVAIFTVAPDKEAYELDSLKTLSVGQTNIGMTLPEESVLLIAEGGTKRYIRKGYNADNDGVDQNEILVVDENGNISADTPVIWDYNNITDVQVIPIDQDVLTIKGGTFTTIVNNYVETTGYFKRGFLVNRSNVVIDGITHYIENEGADGAPYQSFMDIRDCANISVENCVFTPHLTYFWMKNGVRTSVGTYDISPERVANLTMRNCTQTIDILDQRYWGIISTNFCKNIILDNCELSRIDAHQGVHNVKIFNSELGWLGIGVTGSGNLYVEGSTIHGRTLINLRDDYGSTWNGDITIKDCVWRPNRGQTLTANYYSIIGGTNEETHDFGYQCYMPTNITIENLYIYDLDSTASYMGIELFANINPNRISEQAENEMPYHYIVTENVTIKGLTLASGKKWILSTNEYMFKDVDIRFEQNSNLENEMVDLPKTEFN